MRVEHGTKLSQRAAHAHVQVWPSAESAVAVGEHLCEVTLRL